MMAGSKLSPKVEQRLQSVSNNRNSYYGPNDFKLPLSPQATRRLMRHPESMQLELLNVIERTSRTRKDSSRLVSYILIRYNDILDLNNIHSLPQEAQCGTGLIPVLETELWPDANRLPLQHCHKDGNLDCFLDPSASSQIISRGQQKPSGFENPEALSQQGQAPNASRPLRHIPVVSPTYSLGGGPGRGGRGGGGSSCAGSSVESRGKGAISEKASPPAAAPRDINCNKKRSISKANATCEKAPPAAAGPVTRARAKLKRPLEEANTGTSAPQVNAGQANADESREQANACPLKANAFAAPKQPVRKCWQFPAKSEQVAALGELEWNKRALFDVMVDSRTERVNELRVEDIRQWGHLKALELLSQLLHHFPDVPASQKWTAQQICSPQFESSGFLEAHLHAWGSSLEVAQDKGNSAAHRELGWDRLLVLKLEDCRRENLRDIYKGVLTDGFVLGLRRFRCFGNKSSDEKGKPARTFAVAMESESAYDEQHPPLHPAFTSGRPLLHYFGNFAGCPSMRKMAARQQLLFSSTMSVMELSMDKIQVLPDIRCEDGSLATDGAGLVLHHLVPLMYFVQGRVCSPPNLESRPSVLQVRVFCDGMVCKGTLLAVTRMPKGVREGVQILLRKSMVKVPAWEADRAPLPCFSSLEIVKTSRPPKHDTALSRIPVSLLRHGGVPQEYFLGCTEKTLSEVKLASQDRNAAMKLMKGGAINDSFNLGRHMLMCGVELRDPHLQDLLRLKQKEKLKKLAGSSVAAGRSHYLLGVADFTGSLKEGEVYIVTDDGPLAGDCLVHRYPGVQLANIRKLRAVDCPELRSYLPPDARHFIAFSTKGRRSEPDKMAGGDLDGDNFLVIRDPQIVDAFQPSNDFPTEEKGQVAPDPKALGQASPASLSWEEQRAAIIDIFLKSCYSPGVIGTASNLHTVYLDKWGPHDARTIEMGSLYEKALDAEKAGGMAEVLKQVKSSEELWFNKSYPHYMEMARGSYRSRELPGVIHDLVMDFISKSIPGSAEGTRVTEVAKDPKLVQYAEEHPLDDKVQREMRDMMRWLNGRFSCILNSNKSARDREEELKETVWHCRQVVSQGWIPTKDEPTPPPEVLAKVAFIYNHGYDEAKKKFAFDSKLHQQQEQQLQKRQQQQKEEHTGEEHARTGRGEQTVEKLYKCARVRGMKCVWDVVGDLVCTLKALLEGPMLVSRPACEGIFCPSRPLFDLPTDCIMDAQEASMEALVELESGSTSDLPIASD